MHITLIDDSVPFDGTTAGRQPLGGAEKAFASLAAALARRGHRVTAFARCDMQITIAGVTWLPFDMPRPPEADVLIAFRRPDLLGEVRNAGKKILWLATHGKVLSKIRNQEILDRHDPTLVFLSRAHKDTFSPWRDFKTEVIEPGVNRAFLDVAAASGGVEAPLTAVVTTHPLHGLSKIVDLWIEHIHPHAPEATLKVFSGSLARAAESGRIDEKLAAVHETVARARDHGVMVERPRGDDDMARAYGSAAVHLYPRIETEVYGWTLAESQACGCPAVVMADSPAARQVRNGQTGFLVPDDIAFANVAKHLLTNHAARKSMREDTRALNARRGWADVAAEFEGLLS